MIRNEATNSDWSAKQTLCITTLFSILILTPVTYRKITIVRPWIHLILIITSGSMWHYSHFVGEGTEAQK